MGEQAKVFLSIIVSSYIIMIPMVNSTTPSIKNTDTMMSLLNGDDDVSGSHVKVCCQTVL